MYCYDLRDYELVSQKRFRFVMPHGEVLVFPRTCFAFAADISPVKTYVNVIYHV